MSAELRGVAILSPCDVWAVGFYDDPAGAHLTLIEHWDGANWTVVTSPNPGTSFNSWPTFVPSRPPASGRLGYPLRFGVEGVFDSLADGIFPAGDAVRIFAS